MMFSTKSPTFVAALVIGMHALAAAPAHAGNSGTSAYVDNVLLGFEGVPPVITVRNVSANKHVNAVELQAQETHIDFELDGDVVCASGNQIHFDEARAYFGPIGMGGLDNINDSAALYSADIQVSTYKPNDNIIEHTVDTFSVPLSAIDEGHPATRVDPIEEVEKMLQTHLQEGGTAVEFFQDDRQVLLHRPLSLAGWCEKNGLSKAGFRTENYLVRIVYEADPEVFDGPVLNAQLNGNLPNQFDEGYQPIMLADAEFQPNMPHHVGACPAQTELSFSYWGQGSGEIRFRITDDGETIYDSPAIAFESDNGKVWHQFMIAVPAAAPADFNKTFGHTLRLHARLKDAEAGVWENTYQTYDIETWNHRCTPQVKFQAGGSGGLQSPEQAGNGPTSPTIGRVQAPSTPAPRPGVRTR